MANVVEAKVMKYHKVPIIFSKFVIDMPGDIIVDFCKVLYEYVSKRGTPDGTILNWVSLQQRSLKCHHGDQTYRGTV